MNVEGILAHDRNFVIGQGDVIPWKHKGDLQRFRKITTGHSLLMGVRTFMGIANYYLNQNGQVLPRRNIFVLGKPRGDYMDIEYAQIHRKGFGGDWVQVNTEIKTQLAIMGIDDSNVNVICNNAPPLEILQRIETNFNPGTLFIAGGAKTYKDFLPYTDKIHVTTVDTVVQENADNVRLFTETIELIKHGGKREMGGYENSDGLLAYYDTVVR